MRPSPSSPPSCRSSALASFRAGAGGGSRKASEVGSATPQAAQSSRRGLRSADEDFRASEGLERAGRGLFPEAVADARLRAAGAAAPLIGGGARDAHGFQPCQADIRLEDRHAGETGIDDDAHALDGERGLGDGGGEHHLAPPGLRRAYRQILLAALQGAVERREVDGGIGDALAQKAFDPADLPLPRQEDQDGAALGPQGARDRIRYLLVDAAVGSRPR